MDEPDELGDDALRQRWFDASARIEIGEAIGALHEHVGNEIESRRPLCLASGRCCHFEEFGHRLYVTGLEAAWCVRSLRSRGIAASHACTIEAVDAAKERGDCPFLLDGRSCGAHTDRPLGCRIYFCDRASEGWQQSLYERMHREIVALHERHAIPYRYGEWRAMLRAVCA